MVGMEATGDYWKPVYYLYYLLEEAFEVQLLNAAHMHKVDYPQFLGHLV